MTMGETSSNADRWEMELGATEYVTREFRFGIRDMPTVQFEGMILKEVTHRKEENKLLAKDLEKGFRDAVFDRMSWRKA